MTFQLWNPDWFSVPGQAAFDREKQRITVVSRSKDNLDLFVIGNDDRVWSTFWPVPGGWNWNADWFPLPGQARFNHLTQQVAAVARTPTNLDLFVIGNDGHVWSTFWPVAGSVKWSNDWFRLPGNAVFDPANQRLAVVSRAKNNIDLFVIGDDDRVWSTFWNEHGWNADWFPLPGQARFNHLTQQVAVVARTPNNLDLFVIGNDSHVWSTFFPVPGTGTWSPDWFPLPGRAAFDQKQRLAVVSRAKDNLDLFVVGNDDHVWSTFWPVPGTVKWSADWFPLPGQARFNHLTQQVVAAARTAANLDLFVIGNDDHVWSTFWPIAGTSNWNAEWFALPGQAVFDRDNQRLAVVSRTPLYFDLFVIGNDNHAWSTYWAPREPMTLDVHSDQTSTTVPLQVHLHIAASDGIVRETNWSLTKNEVPLPNIGERVPTGIALERMLPINDPGEYSIKVNRIGQTGPGAPTTLMQDLEITALSPLPPTPTPKPTPHPSQSPQINAIFSGTISNASFHVTGSGFLPNRPATNQGIAIRVVDANALVETRREYTSSSSAGGIDHTIQGDLSGLTLNALGVATVAISATDGRSNSADPTGFLWSNTVSINFTA
jgi:hypothetical protein